MKMQRAMETNTKRTMKIKIQVDTKRKRRMHEDKYENTK